MRPFAFALMMSLTALAAASAQPATPDSENDRYSFNPVADGVLRLDTRTGQVSQCSKSDAGWTCNAVPDERSTLETEIARLQGENATLKKELLPSRPGELHPESLTDPDVILSHHPARATMRRLPPSIDDQVPPAAG
jgi:hypothetical protein